MPIVEPQVFLNGLDQELAPLSRAQQLAFGALCCERHLPDYLRFSVNVSWGDPDVLKKAINLAWSVVAGEHGMTRNDLEALLASCVEATPDSDDFPLGVSDYAQDAAIMVCHLIQFIEDGKTSSVVQIASKARDLIDARVQIDRKLKPNDPELEVKIANDPEMVAEFSALGHDLEKVRDVDQLQAIIQSRRSL